VSARVVVLGFDACEVTLVERWCDEGLLPSFARLRERSRQWHLASPMATLPGAIWPEINTGRSAARDGHFYVPNRLRTGEARLRATRAHEIDPEHYYWTMAGRAGRRIAVIDPVQAVPARDLGGVQLFEWGLHDRAFDVQSEPPAFLEALRARHGDHPVRSCDRHGESVAGYRALRDGLVRGAATKAAFACELLRAQALDLFSCTFSESHCAGHQFWHLHDARHPWHARSAPADLRRALLDVYRAIDAAVGQVVDAAGAATVLAVFSHGMDLYFDGPQLLPEVLARLGYASGSTHPLARGARLAKRYVTYLPRPVKAVIKGATRLRALHGPIASAGWLVDPFESARTRAAIVYNNRCGAIRLNLAGREPHGRVAPGVEASRMLDELARELAALRDPASGEPIVAETFTSNERFGPDHHPDLPDLIVVFRTDLGLIETCESPAVGRVHVPVYHPHAPRTGDHTAHSRLWACGEGVDASGAIGRGHVCDIAPTVLALLDVAPSADLDGRSLLDWKASHGAPATAAAPLA
jgi:predicted AlkP superfamily phosphohydrolase/phosphomutase